MTWDLVPGHPRRVARQGVVVGGPDGPVVLRSLAAKVVVELPATVEELRQALPDASAEDVAAVLEDLRGHGVTVEV